MVAHITEAASATKGFHVAAKRTGGTEGTMVGHTRISPPWKAEHDDKSRDLTEPGRFCWVLVNAAPYHAARLRAVATYTSLRPCLIQLAGRNPFPALQLSLRSEESYDHHILFPDKRWDEIDRGSMVRSLSGLLDRLKPAAVCINGWSYGGCIAALGWCVANRVPAILMSESTAHDHPRHGWKEAVKRRIVGLCSASLVGGTPHHDYIAGLGAARDQVFTGYDAVDNEHFRAGADRARSLQQDLRPALSLPPRFFLACARFEQKKNLARLIRAYAAYRESVGVAAWSLVIIGDGKLKNALTALREKLGLREHVLLPGAKSYGELPSYYGLASAFIHTSTTEQWGLVVNEAMAAGLPVLVSERCGCAEDLVVPGLNGLRFNPHDVTAIAKAMTEISSGSRDLCAMGRSSRVTVARWSLTRFAGGLNSAVLAALRASPRAPGLMDHFLLWALKRR